MKKIFLLCTFLSAIIFTACSASVPIDDYEAVVSARDHLQDNLNALSIESSMLQAEYHLLMANHDALMLEKSALENEHNELLNVQASLQNAYNNLRNEASGFFALNEAEIESALAIAQREDEIDYLNTRIHALNTEIEGLNNQVSALQASVIRVAGQSRAFPAGVLYAGSDFDAGRYRIYGGSSNFFVRRNDRSVVNIILGGRNGVSEYIFTFRNGDVIESRSAFRMIPVE